MDNKKDNSKRVITADESYTFFTVLSPEERKLLFAHAGDLAAKYKKEGSLQLDWVVPILGNCPVTPSTHDMDAMPEAADEKAKYEKKVKSIEDFIGYVSQRGYI